MVATDFSPRAMHASHRAALLANAAAASAIELVHVLPPSSPRQRRSVRKDDDLSRRLHAVRDVVQAMTHVPVEARVERGPCVDTLVTASQRADLLVVGASQTAPWLRPLLGSTLALMQRIRIPMLVVREAPKSAYRRVLVTLDLVTPADRALATARTVAPGATLDAVHAYRTAFEGKLQYAGVRTDILSELRADGTRRALLRIAEAASASGGMPGLTAHVVHGPPALRVLDKARELAVDLIVATKSARTRVEEWLVPGVTSRLLEDARADVLVIPR